MRQLLVFLGALVLWVGPAGAQNPAPALEWVKQARQAYDRSAYEEARQLYTRAIEAEPGLAVAYAERADAELQLTRYNEAHADCERAIQLNPRNHFAFFIQGDAFLRLNQTEQAIAALTRAVTLKPDFGSAYLLRARAYRVSKNLENAQADYGRSLAFLPEQAAQIESEQDELTRLLPPRPATQAVVTSQTAIAATNTPSIVWVSPNALKFPDGYPVVGNTLTIELTISAPTTETELRQHTSVWVDGRLYEGKMGEKKLKKSARQQLFSFDYALDLPPGRHSVVVWVRVPGLPPKSSEPLTVLVSDDDKPNLYLLAFGVKSDLLFTRNDADDLRNLFKAQEGQLFEQVDAQAVTGDETTAFDMAARLEELSQRPIRDKDLVIVFFSGHGMLYNDELRLLGYKYRTEAPRTTSLSYRDALIGPLSRLKGKKLILLDACHSGQAVQPGPGERSTPLKVAEASRILADTPPGIAIITSSSSAEKSYEDPVWQNGAFTETLLEALNAGKADANRDGIVWLQELYTYLNQEVPRKVSRVKQARQTPAFRSEGADFPLFGSRPKASH
ncbi:caspase family protein [Rudanella lutea]|uniref:caspase family protein n=1 Tax=Rudanella lutea TaxID=451374 RepID=UPI00037829A3|nr:caspase family protein [Rudanella lutea]